MSTIADYSVFTKAFLTSTDVNFSQLYDNLGQDGALRAFAVIPFNPETPLTPREAMNFDWSKLDLPSAATARRVSCRDANGNFIGNIVRVQPDVREGSIRLVAKVAVPGFVSSEDGSNPDDAQYNTFVLVRTDASTNIDLPIAVATISKGYNLHRHKVVVAADKVGDLSDDTFADPLDAVDNATYVSFTINNLNGYTSVDFDPDAYVTYDVTDALSRRVDVIEGVGGIKGLHITFNSNSGDIILSDAKGNVIDQANLHLDLSADTIIAEGEEGYKYVKTDINQDVYSAKAFMAPPGKDDPYPSAFGSSKAVDYDTKHASLLRLKFDGGKECNGIRVRWTEGADTQQDAIFCILAKEGDGNEETKPGSNFLSCCRYSIDPSDGHTSLASATWFKTLEGLPVQVHGPSKISSGEPAFDITNSVYSHDAFVHTVGNSSLADWDEFFQLAGFHDGDDIPMGTLLPELMKMSSGKLDPEKFIHGVNSQNKENVEAQRKLAKEEMVAYNSRRPALTGDRQQGTIIDYTGLDVRNGSITLGCGRVGEANAFQKVNYGIQMKDRSSDQNIQGRSESLDFTISHRRGEVGFDESGHAAELTPSTLLSIESGSYISGAPTCLILSEVTRDTASDAPVFTPVRMTAGFSVAQKYDASSGLSLTLHDYRDNILGLLNPDGTTASAPAIIEVQALYTHPNAETIPAQQMHTYIGKWMYISPSNDPMNHPECSFLCNKIEDWMMSVGLTDAQNQDSKLYVVIRVY